MEMTITAGVVLAVISVVCYWAIKILCDKKATDYFNAKIKDQFEQMFNGYKREILIHLEDLKGMKEFKASKLLILNDSNNKLHNLSYLADFTNKIVVNLADEKIDYTDIAIAVMIAESDDELRKFTDVLKRLDTKVPILIYTLSRLDTSILEDRLYALANSEFTLLERLHSAYMIKKIMEDKA